MSSPPAPLRAACAFLTVAVLAAPLSVAGQNAPPATHRAHTSDLSSEHKSVAIARGLSIGTMGATAVGGGVAIAGDRPILGGLLISSSIFVAPSAGIFYAGDSRRAWQGMAVRGGGAAGAAVLTGLLGSAVGSSGGEDPGPFLNVVFFVSGLGALGVVAHGVYDAVFVSARSVKAHNADLNRTATAVSVGPWRSPHDGRPGVQLRVTW